jgi:hypothetical protein
LCNGRTVIVNCDSAPAARDATALPDRGNDARVDPVPVRGVHRTPAVASKLFQDPPIVVKPALEQKSFCFFFFRKRRFFFCLTQKNQNDL